MFIGVFAVTQACWQHDLHSSTGQWWLLFAKHSVAVHWGWVTAQLYEQQVFIGLFAAILAVLHGSTGQWWLLTAKNSVAVHWGWVTAQLYEQQMFIDLVAVTLAVLHSSTGQWWLLFAKNSVAVNWYWVTAQLYEQQMFIGVFAVTQACWQPVLHSSTGQWWLLFAKNSVAVHWCWVTAQLYEQQMFIGLVAVTLAVLHSSTGQREQISIGAIAMTQACCEPVLQSTSEQWGMHFARTSAALHLCWFTAHLYEQQISIGAIAVT